MTASPAIGYLALLGLWLAAIGMWRRRSRDGVFWLFLALAAAGPIAWLILSLEPGWRTGLAPAIWLSITAALLVFAILAALDAEAWKLAILLMPYLGFLAVGALVFARVAGAPVPAGAPGAWLGLHILVSLATYGALTLASMGAVAVVVHERALKRRRISPLSGRLPAIADAERIQCRLLVVGEIILGLGVVTGISTQFEVSRQLLRLDHKTLLTLMAFALVAVLIGLQRRTGLRGRQAARLVLLAYLLVSLAYLGVKFVMEVLIGA